MRIGFLPKSVEPLSFSQINFAELLNHTKRKQIRKHEVWSNFGCKTKLNICQAISTSWNWHCLLTKHHFGGGLFSISYLSSNLHTVNFTLWKALPVFQICLLWWSSRLALSFWSARCTAKSCKTASWGQNHGSQGKVLTVWWLFIFPCPGWGCISKALQTSHC